MPTNPASDDDKFCKIMKMVAPGTVLHEGLENILRARTGALIVVGDTPTVLDIVSGGFRLDYEVNPSALYELAKMDGAIILSSDAKRILYANTQLVPDPDIPSQETGTRHRTAERVAKQTGELVIAISQRRNVITLFKGTNRYVLKDVPVVLTKANQALQTLENYRAALVQGLTNLSALEFEAAVTLQDVARVIQRGEMVSRVAGEIERYICELGVEGRLVAMQLEELMLDIEDEIRDVFKDYVADEKERQVETVRAQLRGWSAEDLLDVGMLSRALGYAGAISPGEYAVTPRGYRALARIPRLPSLVIENIVKAFGNLENVLKATIEELDQVEGIGEVRARAIHEGLRRFRDHVMGERRI